MAYRKVPLVSGEVYHIYNRGVEKRPVFQTIPDYSRFILLLQFYQRVHSYQFSRLTHNQRLEVIRKADGLLLVEIISYCLMPNHYHLVLKQIEEGGISRLARIVSDGYVKYFNKVHDRVGPLFQGKFQSVHIEDDNQLLHLTRYQHLNPVTAGLVPAPRITDYRWSSYNEYLGNAVGFCTKNLVLEKFSSKAKYKRFVEDYADYAKKLKKIDYLLLEEAEK